MIDTNKLYKLLINDKTLQDIPIKTIIKVTVCVINVLTECIKEEDYE